MSILQHQRLRSLRSTYWQLWFPVMPLSGLQMATIYLRPHMVDQEILAVMGTSHSPERARSSLKGPWNLAPQMCLRTALWVYSKQLVSFSRRGWIPRRTEWERTMWCATCVLGFTVKMKNFQVEIPFTRLGHLVRMLAMHCQDPVDGICSLSAEATCNLYCVLLPQKHLHSLSHPCPPTSAHAPFQKSQGLELPEHFVSMEGPASKHLQ
nr:uncharacterized protein LOC105867765 [Microcebus murinus]